jgi:hypothetical protein
MAFAKLSGSLLERRGALLTAMLEQRESEPSDVSDPDEFVAPISVRLAAARSSAAVSANERDRQSGPIGHVGLAVWGIAATTAFAVVLVMHFAGQTSPTNAQAGPEHPHAGITPGIVTGNGVGTAAPEPVGVAPSAPPAQPAISVASARLAPPPAPAPTTPTAAVEPIPPRPEPVVTGYAPAPSADKGDALPASVAPAPATPQPRRLSEGEVAALLERGDASFSAGDVVSARLFYQHAAEAGDGAAALRLGEAFDPAFLERVHLGRMPGDVQKALFWYLQASDLGNSDAEILLKGLGFTGKR